MTKVINILGNEFEVSQPYAAGHTITEMEAKALNQVRAENIANNFRKHVKDAGEDEAAMAKVRADFAAYDAEYVFTAAASRSSATTMTPVEKVALTLARTVLAAKLKEAGKTLKAYKAEVGDEAYEAKLAEIAAMEQVVAAATKQVKERDSMLAKVSALG